MQMINEVVRMQNKNTGGKKSTEKREELNTEGLYKLRNTHQGKRTERWRRVRE